MASVENLPGDQRAVLQLVLSRGRSYDQIAQLLSINPASVRERALAALDALGPDTGVSPEHRGMIADYLLGQLSPDETGTVRELLAGSPSERAWGRVVASELAPLAGEALPEIPTDTSAGGYDGTAGAEPGASGPGAEPASATGPSAAGAPASAEADDEPASDAAATAEAVRQRSRRRDRRQDADEFDEAEGRPRSSRLGGAVVIALAILVVAVVLFLLLRPGSSSPRHHVAATPPPTTSSAASASTSSATTATSTSSGTAAKVIAQINLSPPNATSKAAGIAEVLNEGSSNGIAIVAQNVPPNSTKPPNAYAVWLYNSPTDAHLLGFVNPSVGSSGRFSTATALPTGANHYKQLIVTLETSGQPKTPGTVILQGTLTGV